MGTAAKFTSETAFLSVDAHVKAEGKNMLVHMGFNAGGHADTVFGGRFGPGSGAHAECRLP